MPSLRSLLPRDDVPISSDMEHQKSALEYAIIVVGLVFFALLLVITLMMIRRVRRTQQLRAAMIPDGALPSYQASSNSHNPRGLTIQTTGPNGRSSYLVINRDGQPMLMNPQAPPHSPDNIPEIHITFPDEQDEQGRQRSGRVVVVRVGDNATVGLEPLHREEQLPAYEKESKSQFYSIDMNQIGGLKEKDRDEFR